MASPKLESFCCMRFDHNDTCTNSTYEQYDLRSINISYNVLCIVSSLMSICGAAYQLTPRLPRRPPRSRTELESMLRQNVIICVLAVADLLASLGLSHLSLMNSHDRIYFRHSYLLHLFDIYVIVGCHLVVMLAAIFSHGAVSDWFSARLI